MHSITVFLASFLLCNFVTTFTIIQSDLVYNDIVDFLDNNDLSYENLEPTANNNILETMYAKQMVGKSHRFFFTTGERKDGDKLLDHVFKQTGWKTQIDARLNITYPNERSITNLTFVMLTVYQESDVNRINVIEGGAGKPNIIIGIQANKTKYLSYDIDFYGFSA